MAWAKDTPIAELRKKWREKKARQRKRRKAEGTLLVALPEKQKEYRQRYEAKYRTENGVSPSYVWAKKNVAHVQQLKRVYKDEGRYKQTEKRLARERTVRDKVDCLNAYGGLWCACCGETGFMFLTLDHVNSDGAAHRKQMREAGYSNMYRYLQDLGYPTDRQLQVLCWNCNCGRDKNGGICPHKEAA